MMGKFRWIQEGVEIDFALPNEMQNLIANMEEMDLQEDYGYFNFFDALDCSAKELVVQGRLTQKQWDMLFKKYSGGI